jgi:hypothetical protein
MPAVSEARIFANRANALKSSGPKTPEGKAVSRRNGLKHGLTGSGVVLASEDSSEVELRTTALMGELNPQSTLGRVLVGQLATLSVRMERVARQEEAAIDRRVRHAPEVFDQERLDRAEDLFARLAEAPRERLRDLKKRPEGVDRLLRALGELRDRLPSAGRALWSLANFETLANLLGHRPDDRRISGLKAITEATWGQFHGLTVDQGAGLDESARKRWACDQLIERIDHEIEALEAHRESLDFETIELDRRGAADIALFDPSKEATLARRYEAEARRGFFKSLEKLRQVEAEAEAAEPAVPPSVSEPEPEPLGSSCAGVTRTAREPKPGPGPAPSRTFESQSEVARGVNGQVVTIGRAGKPPR